jgi:hypothetical protein
MDMAFILHSQQIMFDPVILCETGISYDRRSIKQWIHLHRCTYRIDPTRVTVSFTQVHLSHRPHPRHSLIYGRNSLLSAQAGASLAAAA